MLKIRCMPPPEPCRGLREKTDATPPAPGKDESDFTGEKSIRQAAVFIFLVRPSKNPDLSVCMQFVDSIISKGISC